jgi:ribosome maturation factor RimP
VVPYFIGKSMITERSVQELVERHIRGTDIFLVEVAVRTGNTIRVLVDRPEGISIDECTEISRFLNLELDRDVEDYALEVSSPGLGSPFRVKQQYVKNIGRVIELFLRDGSRLEGELESMAEEGIVLKMKDGAQEIRFDAIRKAREIIAFN